MSKRTLTGIAGVHFVVAELSRRGWISLPTIRNTAGIDILAHKDGKSVQLQVKTRRDSRRFTLRESAEQLIGENLYYVFVNLKQHDSPEYFIFHSSMVADYVTRTHKMFLQAGRKENAFRTFPNVHQKIALDDYESNWEILEYIQQKRIREDREARELEEKQY